MFDITKILNRSWHILWKYRILWIFGFFLAMAAGGSTPNSPASYQFGQRDIQSWEITRHPRWLGMNQQEILHMLIVTGIILLVVILIWVAITTILRYVAEVSTIRAVKDYEQDGIKLGFKQLFKNGWNPKAWRLFLINLLLSVPVIIYLLLLGLIGLWIYVANTGGSAGMEVFSIVTSIGLFILFSLAMFLVGIAITVIGRFAARVCVLEDKGVIDSIKEGFNMVRRHLKNVFFMWLVMIGIGIAWGLATFLALIPLFLVVALLVLPGVLAAVLPFLAGTGLAALFGTPSPWYWIIGAIVGLPLFFLVAFSPFTLVGGWKQLFDTNVWTETYLELKAIEMPSAPVKPVKPILPAGRKVAVKPAAGKATTAKPAARATAVKSTAAKTAAVKGTAAKPAAKPKTAAKK